MVERVRLASGVTLSCRSVAGGAPGAGTALLVHGVNANMAFWHPHLVQRLRGERRLLMYDLRGHGYSDMPAAGYTSRDLAEDALGVLDSQDVETADLVAHSFGAAAALQLAWRHPGRVRSLALLDARVFALQPALRLKDWEGFERWRGHFERAGIEFAPELEVDFHLPELLEGDLWEQVRQGLESDGFFVPQGGRRTRARQRKLARETSAASEVRDAAGLTAAALGEIPQPTLVVYGARSAYLPTRDGLAAGLPDCRTALVEGGGHNFPFTAPEETAAGISAFWGERAPEAQSEGGGG
ncbi:MAG: alpha/beta hydrolase [Planctomycetota bacterium]|nr:alpha/beta hydrolase [Planctomycetota bacterium]MDP6763122.1 alpha/beta hydrolase [Planctomycetota bacterium]